MKRIHWKAILCMRISIECTALPMTLLRSQLVDNRPTTLRPLPPPRRRRPLLQLLLLVAEWALRFLPPPSAASMRLLPPPSATMRRLSLSLASSPSPPRLPPRTRHRRSSRRLAPTVTPRGPCSGDTDTRHRTVTGTRPRRSPRMRDPPRTRRDRGRTRRQGMQSPPAQPQQQHPPCNRSSSLDRPTLPAPVEEERREEDIERGNPPHSRSARAQPLTNQMQQADEQQNPFRKVPSGVSPTSEPSERERESECVRVISSLPPSALTLVLLLTRCRDRLFFPPESS